VISIIQKQRRNMNIHNSSRTKVEQVKHPHSKS
jgi:hypothetical protein